MSTAVAAELDHVTAAVTGAVSGDDLDPALWGPAPEPAEVSAAVLNNLRERFTARRDLEQQSITRSDAAGLLGCSEQAVTDHLEARRLLGFKTGRSWVIPAWRLHQALKKRRIDIGVISSQDCSSCPEK